MMKKFLLGIFVLLISLFTFSIMVAANETSTVEYTVPLEEYTIEEDTSPIVEPDPVIITQPDDTIARTVSYYKTGVTTTYEWSGYKRVSDNVYAGAAGGSISSSDQVTFQTTASGAYSGLGFSFSKSLSSTLGYTLNLAPYQKAYMGWKVMNKVERGTRVTKMGSNIISRDTYVVKIPQYGQYALLRAY